MQQRHAEALLAGAEVADDNFAVLLPGCQAAGYLKRWGAARYAALAQRLRNAGIPRLMLLGGQDELEEYRQIAAAAGPQVINLRGRK